MVRVNRNVEKAWAKVQNSELFWFRWNWSIPKGFSFGTTGKWGITILLISHKSWTIHHPFPLGFWVVRSLCYRGWYWAWLAPGWLGLLLIVVRPCVDSEFNGYWGNLARHSVTSICAFYSSNVGIRSSSQNIRHLDEIKGLLLDFLSILRTDCKEHKRSGLSWLGNSKVRSSLEAKCISPFNLERRSQANRLRLYHIAKNSFQ